MSKCVHAHTHNVLDATKNVHKVLSTAFVAPEFYAHFKLSPFRSLSLYSAASDRKEADLEGLWNFEATNRCRRLLSKGFST